MSAALYILTLSSLTQLTKCRAFSGGVFGNIPWPRLKMCPGPSPKPARTRSVSCLILSFDANKTHGSRFPCIAFVSPKTALAFADIHRPVDADHITFQVRPAFRDRLRPSRKRSLELRCFQSLADISNISKRKLFEVRSAIKFPPMYRISARRRSPPGSLRSNNQPQRRPTSAAVRAPLQARRT